MQNNYRIYHRKQDLGKRISQLHREEQLAIGILDVGTAQELENSIAWYVANMNCCLHVITQDDRIQIQEMQEAWPEITWLVFSSVTTLGERLNALADECYTTYFMVVRSDQEMLRFEGTVLMPMMSRPDHPAVLAPVLSNMLGELLPSVRAPHLRGKDLDPISFMPGPDNTATLYPFLGLGIYDRALFQRLRGYDEQIISNYWQCLDFGARCWLYGYQILTVHTLALEFPGRQSVIEDRSEQPGVERCYTKLLSVQQIGGKNFVHKWRRHTDKALLNDEVRKRMAVLFKTDFFTLIKTWKSPEGDA